MPLSTCQAEATNTALFEPCERLVLIRGPHRGSKLAGTFGVLVLAKGHSPCRLQMQQGIIRRNISHWKRRRRAQFGNPDYPRHPLGQILVLLTYLPEPDIAPVLDGTLTGVEGLTLHDGSQDSTTGSTAMATWTKALSPSQRVCFTSGNMAWKSSSCRAPEVMFHWLCRAPGKTMPPLADGL